MKDCSDVGLTHRWWHSDWMGAEVEVCRNCGAERATGLADALEELRPARIRNDYDAGYDQAITQAQLLIEGRAAQGTEARRAETAQMGSVHDGPVPEGNAP